ncbi:helix-turn-helix transcriptional regulator [Shimazuella sp. AN120528]|uniref:winged helix-turn-helix transcriptional regulator n=1 Tax=Shimazuella soli TaxID=1892854 RepID=UPI001F105C0A|nr:helix-turn-helix domain-containing protein [Shimazuella soli]MCH5583677.1 helix-turn-helix transcriptional regulator [Shimazuella soli]
MKNVTAAKPEISVQKCSYMRVLEIVSSKWAVLIIAALADGTKRYGDLRRRIEGISQKMLTQTVRQLERDGLVKRYVHDSVPPSVEYELTPIGQTILPHLFSMKQWVNEYYAEVERARQEYDRTDRK